MNFPRAVAMIVVLVTAALVETVLLAEVTLSGVTPPLVLLTVAGFGLSEGPGVGLRYGFAAGLLVDLLSGGLVGLSALVYLVGGYLAGISRPYLSGTELIGQLTVGAAVCGGGILGYSMLTVLFDPGQMTITEVFLATLAAAFFGGVLTPVVIKPIAALCARLDLLFGAR